MGYEYTIFHGFDLSIRALADIGNYPQVRWNAWRVGLTELGIRGAIATEPLKEG